MEKIVIVSGGKIEDDFACDWLEHSKPDYIIVADSGMEFLKRVGKIPDMIIGDFDSVSADTLDWFKKTDGIIWKKLNPVKDDTDTEFAIRCALELGAIQIELLGATGSRIDHVLGNIELLGMGMVQGVEITIIDSHNRIRMIRHGMTLSKEKQFGSYISLIPYSKEVTGLTLSGFKYPLQNAILKGFCSLGVSNEIVTETAEIIFEQGILIVIESRD